MWEYFEDALHDFCMWRLFQPTVDLVLKELIYDISDLDSGIAAVQSSLEPLISM